MDFNDFNPLQRGYMIMPKSMVCKDCGKVVAYSPFTMITFMNKQRMVENMCDPCIQKMVIEGKKRLAEWEEKNYKEQRAKKEFERDRLVRRDEEEKKQKKDKKDSETD